MRDALINLFESSGFQCFVPLEAKSCFDIAGKSEKQFFLIKILNNIDSLRESQAFELKALAHSLGATVLLVGEKSKAYVLSNGVVYERYGVPTISFFSRWSSC